MLAFHLNILKRTRSFFSNSDTLHNEYCKIHLLKFVLKSFATQFKPRLSLPTNNTATDLRYLKKGLLNVIKLLESNV